MNNRNDKIKSTQLDRDILFLQFASENGDTNATEALRRVKIVDDEIEYQKEQISVENLIYQSNSDHVRFYSYMIPAMDRLIRLQHYKKRFIRKYKTNAKNNENNTIQ